jgi:sugar/nucleoside kinase (ribokinase family)
VRVVCAADCGVDRYLDLGVERAGGIGLNVAVNAHRLLGVGHGVEVVAPLGEDAGADLVRHVVDHEGLGAILPARPGSTPVQEIRLEPDGERTFVAYHPGVLSRYHVGSAERAAIAAADVVATTAFGDALPFFESVMAAPTHGLRLVDFTNLSDVGDPVAFVERWAPALDVGLCGLRQSDAALIDALEDVARRHDTLIVVTLGPAGSVALGADGQIHVPAAEATSVVDTTGAGDAYTAGFLTTYVRTSDVRTAMAQGSAVAASTLGHLGSFDLAELAS